jgi:hypothetical protein
VAVGDAAANPVLTDSCRSVAAMGDNGQRAHKAVDRSSHLRPIELIPPLPDAAHNDDAYAQIAEYSHPCSAPGVRPERRSVATRSALCDRRAAECAP